MRTELLCISVLRLVRVASGPKVIVLGFNDVNLVGHFVSSPRERGKRDRRYSKRA